MNQADYHVPVLPQKVVNYLVTDMNGLYVDATVGGGGHTAALLSVLSSGGRVVAVDRDAEAIAAVRARFPDAIKKKKLMVYQATFSHLETLISEFIPVTGLLLDLGVSSRQLDSGSRGFSHRKSAPLDMRMDQSAQMSATAIVNESCEEELVNLLQSYGEEPHARKICRSIIDRRPVNTTVDLARIVRDAVPVQSESRAVARTFQAIRIAVNQELDELAQILESSPKIVIEQGRVVVISYHSLEDRMVKRIFRDGVFSGDARRDLYGNRLVPWQPLTRRPVVPDDTEISSNRRSRSARLRAAVRCSTPSDQNHEIVFKL